LYGTTVDFEERLMKNRVTYFAITFLSLMLLPTIAFSQDKYVFDNAHQLSDTERIALEARLADIKNDYNFNVVIATEESIGGEDIEAYGDDFYDKNGFGGEAPGVLLLLVTDEMHWYMNTFDESPYSDVVNEDYEKYFLQYLLAEPAIAYNAFIDDVEQYLNPAAPKKYVNDHAHVLSGDEINALEKRIAAIKNTYGINVVFITEEHLAEDYVGIYADDFYYNADFGENGALLIAVQGSGWDDFQGWYVGAYGEGPSGGDTLLDRVAIQESEYFEQLLFYKTSMAFNVFLDDVERCLNPAAPQKHVYDSPHLLTDAEINALNERIVAIRNAYDFDVVLVTEESIYGEDPMDYADDFFDYRGGGFGNGKNGGVLLLWVTDIRWAWFSGFGTTPLGGETIFNDFTIAASDKHIDKYLKADEGGVDDTYGMYNRFLDDVEQYLGLAAKGRHYNVLHEYLHVFLIIAWIVALLAGLIIVSVWKAGMNTA
jgi:uncharacterized membrane protein YgcG